MKFVSENARSEKKLPLEKKTPARKTAASPALPHLATPSPPPPRRFYALVLHIGVRKKYASASPRAHQALPVRDELLQLGWMELSFFRPVVAC